MAMYAARWLDRIFRRAPIRTEVSSPFASNRLIVESDTHSQSEDSRKDRRGGLGDGAALGVTGFNAAAAGSMG